MEVKFSIIVPTLDGEVRAKIPEREGVELIVVKGVSPVGRARNEGLRRARGEYLAWVDSDDEVSEEWLEEIVGVISGSGKADVITFDAELVGWGGRPAIVWGERKPTIERLLEAVCHDVNRVSALWLYVTRRALWEGLKFTEEISIIEDYLILPDVLKRAKSVCYLPKRLYRYYANPKSLCHENDPARERRVIELKEMRRKSFPPGRYRNASQLSMAVAHYYVAARVMHKLEGYDTEEWRCAARASERWMARHLFRVLVEIGYHACLPRIERIAWIYRLVICACRAWWLHRLLWNLRHTNLPV